MNPINNNGNSGVAANQTNSLERAFRKSTDSIKYTTDKYKGHPSREVVNNDVPAWNSEKKPIPDLEEWAPIKAEKKIKKVKPPIQSAEMEVRIDEPKGIKSDMVLVYDTYLDNEIMKIKEGLQKVTKNVFTIPASYLKTEILPKANFLVFNLLVKTPQQDSETLKRDIEKKLQICKKNCVVVALVRSNSQKDLNVFYEKNILLNSGFVKDGSFEKKIVVQPCSIDHQVSLITDEISRQLIQKIAAIFTLFVKEKS